MGILEAIILGVVQGLAEFLPVSSSGHLQIAKEALGVSLADNLTFDVMLHVATVLATIVVLWSEVTKLFTGVLKFRYNHETVYFLKILLSMVPIGFVGFVFRDRLNEMLASPHIIAVVGAMLILTAALLIFANYAKERQKTDISWTDAFIIGVSQAIATIPGLSRSGTTIATGLILGNKKAVVAQFSFLMVILPILGEAFLDVVRGDFSAGLGVGIWPLAAGFAAAFIVGCLACKFMIEMVKRSKLVWFAVYCTVVGTATLIYCFI
jgi:undecaprenyl-diphosphatase